MDMRWQVETRTLGYIATHGKAYIFIKVNEEAHVTRGLHPMAVKVTSQPRRKRVISLVWLYNGFGCLATGRMLGVGARFGTYELLTVFYKDDRKDNYVYVSTSLKLSQQES
ncbi:hypothetical protein HanPI659440_Chr13g0508091 [Helianthus annuus]|nr:hypothetical protein HanPI659440_Chr13g0508091 [Helianthus annuus]